jgi:hypothetical protein
MGFKSSGKGCGCTFFFELPLFSVDGATGIDSTFSPSSQSSNSFKPFDPALTALTANTAHQQKRRRSTLRTETSATGHQSRDTSLNLSLSVSIPPPDDTSSSRGGGGGGGGGGGWGRGGSTSPSSAARALVAAVSSHNLVSCHSQVQPRSSSHHTSTHHSTSNGSSYHKLLASSPSAHGATVSVDEALAPSASSCLDPALIPPPLMMPSFHHPSPTALNWHSSPARRFLQGEVNFARVRPQRIEENDSVAADDSSNHAGYAGMGESHGEERLPSERPVLRDVPDDDSSIESPLKFLIVVRLHAL